MRVLYGLRTVGKDTLPIVLESIFMDSFNYSGESDIYIVEKAQIKGNGSIFNDLVNALLFQIRDRLGIFVRMQRYNEKKTLGGLVYEIIDYAKRNGYDYLVLVDDDVMFRINWNRVYEEFENDNELVWLSAYPIYGTKRKRKKYGELVGRDMLDVSLAVLKMDRVELKMFEHLKDVSFGEFLIAGNYSKGKQVMFLERRHMGYEQIGLSNEKNAIRELDKWLRVVFRNGR